jgi:zinc protease
MLLRGTAGHSFEGIYDSLEAVGASLSISGGRHIADFGAKGLAEDLDLLLDLLAEGLRRPTFPEAQIEQLRGEILTGLEVRANDTRHMAGLRFRETLYGPSHPYGYASGGYPDTIRAITRDDLTDFHAAYYGPQGMIITAVSPLPAATVAERIAGALGDWHVAVQRALAPVPPAPRPAALTRVFEALAGKTQSDVIIGLPGPSRSAPDYLDVSMVNTIIGVFGMSGRLGKNVREAQGLAYYAFSRLQGGLGPAPWYASTGVAPDKVEQALAAMRDEIRRIQDEPVGEDELADSQAYRTGTMPVSLETSDGLAGVLMDLELYDLGLDYLQRFPDLIHAMTPARVQAAAQKYLSADEVVVAVAGPPDEE